MNRISTEELKLGQQLESVFLVKSRYLRGFRDRDGHFMSLVLGDRSGEVDAVLWEGAEEVYSTISPGDMVLVTGKVREYRASLQLNLFSVDLYRGDDVDPADFLPVAPVPPGEMLKELGQITSSVKKEPLKQLLDSFFSDSAWVKAFAAAPAAKKNHQAYLGGLLEHTLKVTSAAAKLAEVYPQVDRDLLICGAVLHDIGKIEEYCYRTYIDFTDQGRLLGHVVLGARSADTAMEKIPGFPEHLRLKLLHIITSHHGRYEWQSPKRPKFLEAALVHHVDLLDASVDMFTAAAQENNEEDGCWTGWVKGLERFVYTG